MQAKPWKHITKMHESVYYPVRVQATVALALAGALFVSQILQEQGAFSVPRPADRQGALKAPNRESGTELWSQLKTPNAGKQEGKVGGEKGGCSCSFSADFVFSAWVFFFFPPSLVLENVRVQFVCDAEHLHLNLRESGATPRCFFLMKIREKIIQKWPPWTIMRTADIIKGSRLFGGWKDRIQETGGNVMQCTWVYFHGNNISPCKISSASELTCNLEIKENHSNYSAQSKSEIDTNNCLFI